MTNLKLMAAVAAILVLAGSIGTVWAGEPEVRLGTRLAGGAIGGLEPSGHADFRARSGRARLNVEVEDVNLAEGTALAVSIVVDGMKISAGTIRVSAAPVRGGELELNTQDGQSVPAVKSGTMVIVEGPNGAIMSGVL